MAKRRILIVGGAGLLGLNWAQTTKFENDVILGVHKRKPDLTGTRLCEADFSLRDEVKRAVDETEPHIIINAAGLTNVEMCENNPELADRLNIDVAKWLAKASNASNCRLIHISTDHLFDDAGSPYLESAKTAPLNEYARSKVCGEQEVRNADDNALILRTNFFAWGSSYRQSFSDWIVSELGANRTIGLFDDVHFSPLVGRHLITAAHQLLDQGLGGVYNLSADDIVSKYDFGLLLAKHFALDASLISQISPSDLSNLVHRPRLMGLVNDKARQALGRDLGSVEDQISELKLSQFSPEAMEVQKQ